MKKIKVLGISLGSSKRDKIVTLHLKDKIVEVERLGTDGSIEKAQKLYRQYDGKADAFGLGGIDLYLYADKKRYIIRDAKRMIKGVKKTPVLDGSGLKNFWEPIVMEELQKDGIIDFSGKSVLVTSGVERFQSAKKIRDLGAKISFGDLLFGLNIPILIHNLKVFYVIVWILLPIVTQLPISVIYPTGKRQEKSSNKYSKYYRGADIITGDFHMIKKYEPDNLRGKIFITNTVTSEDIERLGNKGLKLLITTTPNFGGRSFGANVSEALMVALSGKKELDVSDYLRLTKEYGLGYYVKKFY
jgi:hypothetical protein